MIQLYEQMQQYQFDQTDPDKPLDTRIRTLTDDDVDRYNEPCMSYLLLQVQYLKCFEKVLPAAFVNKSCIHLFPLHR